MSMFRSWYWSVVFLSVTSLPGFVVKVIMLALQTGLGSISSVSTVFYKFS